MKKYFSFSILLHVALISFFIFYIINVHHPVGINQRVIHAYVYQYDHSSKVNLNERLQKKTKQKKDKLKKRRLETHRNPNIIVHSKKRAVHIKSLLAPLKPASQNSPTAPSKSTSQITVGQYTKLLALLHNSIAKAQQYPTNAALLNQRGTVTVEFLLYPHGQIRSIQIIKTSGYLLLNNAAIQAVQAIAPFGRAHSFLNNPQRFKLKLVF